MIKDVLKTLRINHYVKNLIVFVPLIFSLNFLNINLYIKTTLIFFACCFVSSSVYILNDLIDAKRDKRHPIKCNRPIANGRITRLFAIILMLFFLFLSFVLSCYVNKTCLLFLVLYFVLNVFYSIYLKNIIIVDVICIAIGFILRILAGCFAICVLPSVLVILLTFFLSSFFTWLKRGLEIHLIKSNVDIRKSLQGLDSNLVKKFILINAILSIAFYLAYMFDVSKVYKSLHYMYVTAIPFSLIIFRLYLLNTLKSFADDPMVYIEKDKILKSFFLFYFIVMFIAMLF